MWCFKIVSNFTRLTAGEFTYNNFGIYAKYHYKSCYYLYKFVEFREGTRHFNVLSCFNRLNNNVFSISILSWGKVNTRSSHFINHRV